MLRGDMSDLEITEWNVRGEGFTSSPCALIAYTCVVLYCWDDSVRHEF